MIITLTPNPSLDRSIEIDELIRGAVIRARRNWAEPAGKGLNVSRGLRSHGFATRSVFPRGGGVGDQMVQMLEAEEADFIAVPIHDPVRANISVIEPDGTVTKLNEVGPNLNAAEAQALIDAAISACGAGDWVVGCGSLPPGVTDDFYAGMAIQAAEAGARAAVDTSGPALQACLAGLPALIKPNHHELAELVSAPIRTLGDAAEAAQTICAQGVSALVVSLGVDGALLVDEDGVVHGEAHPAQVRSTVGAGDAVMAGFLAGGGSGPEALANALAWATAACRVPGSLMAVVNDEDRAAVQIHDRVDLTRVLAE